MIATAVLRRGRRALSKSGAAVLQLTERGVSRGSACSSSAGGAVFPSPGSSVLSLRHVMPSPSIIPSAVRGPTSGERLYSAATKGITRVAGSPGRSLLPGGLSPLPAAATRQLAPAKVSSSRRSLRPPCCISFAIGLSSHAQQHFVTVCVLRFGTCPERNAPPFDPSPFPLCNSQTDSRQPFPPLPLEILRS